MARGTRRNHWGKWLFCTTSPHNWILGLWWNHGEIFPHGTWGFFIFVYLFFLFDFGEFFFFREK